MTQEQFTPWPRLQEGLSRDADDGKPLVELVVPKREIFDDLSLVLDDAKFLATRGTAAHLARISELTKLEALWANPASLRLFELCSQAPSLRAIYVTYFKTIDKIPLDGANRLEHLLLNWAPRLVDLSFLAKLPALRTVYLGDMKRIDLKTLPVLDNVRGVYLDGGMWSTLKVDSLEPLTRLSNVRHLTLSNVRPADGSLDPLAKLKHLRKLRLPNFFELEEFARLSAALEPRIELTPFYDSWNPGTVAGSAFKCKKCGGPSYMMTGKPASILCSSCDASKIQRRIARWEIARQSA